MTALVHRADLERALDVPGHGLPSEAMARFCGFEWQPPPADDSPEPLPMPPESGTASAGPGVGSTPSRPPVPRVSPLQFWHVEETDPPELGSAGARALPPKDIRDARDLSDKELGWEIVEPALTPLVPWSRLWPFLRSALGRSTAGSQPDLGKVLRRLEQGRSIDRLPRRPRRGWHPQVHVWIDRREDLAPFWADMDDVLDRLSRMRGASGLRVRVIERQVQGARSGSATGFRAHPVPGSREAREMEARIARGEDPARLLDLRLPEASDVVLVLGDLGQYLGPTGAEPWIRVGRSMARRGVAAHALCPCPRTRWLPEVARAWNAVEWDRAARIPRHGVGQRALPSLLSDAPARRAAQDGAVNALLALVAPAVNVEWGLLRDVRFLGLAHGADVGSERDVCAAHLGACLGITRPPGIVQSLRRQVAGWSRERLRKIVSLVRRHHAYCKDFIGHMEVMGLHDVLPEAAWNGLIEDGVLHLDDLRRARAFMASLAKKLSAHPDAAEEEDFRNFGWREFQRMGGHARTEVAYQVLWGLHNRGNAELPPGFDVANLQFLNPADPSARDVQVRLLDDGLWFGSVDRLLSGLATGFDDRSHAALCHVRVLGASDLPPLKERQVAWDEGQVLRADDLLASRRIEILHERRRTILASMERPYWADRMYHDGNGLVADLGSKSGGVSFRWEVPSASSGPAGGSHEVSGRIQGRWNPCGCPPWADALRVDEWGVVASFDVHGVRFAFRWIPPGRFWMGSPEHEPGRFELEGPRHEVELSHGYWLGETPVTQAQWRAVVEAAPGSRGLKVAPSHFQGPASLPVESVSWDDALQWMTQLTAHRGTGASFTLPTEAQWERACRAGTDTALYTGDIVIRGDNDAPALDAIAWYGGNSGEELEVQNPINSSSWSQKQYPHQRAGTHPVGLKQPNGWGLRDMIGNVWEWCRDEMRPYDERVCWDPGDADAILASGNASRVVRGGSWLDQAGGCRSAFRYDGPRVIRGLNLGLRLLAGHRQGAAEPPAAERPGAPEARSHGPAARGRGARRAGP